jgi:hypothetical protein
MGGIWTKITRQNASDDFSFTDQARSTTLPLYDTEDVLMDSSDDFMSSNTLYYTLPDGSRRPSGGHREKQCMTCGEWIKLGNVDAGQGALINHEGNARCLATAHKNKLEVERLAADAALDDLRRNISISPRTPFASRQPPSFSYTQSPALSFTSGSSTRHMLGSECPGVPLVWDPDDVSAIFNSYPWTRHGIREHPLGYGFPMAKYDGADITGFDIRSTTCTGYSYDGNACSQCRQLPSKVKNLRKISLQAPGTLNFKYQTHDQLTQGHRIKNEIIRNHQLTVSQMSSHNQILLTAWHDTFATEY